MDCPPGYICIGLTGLTCLLIVILIGFYLLTTAQDKEPSHEEQPHQKVFRPQPVYSNTAIPRDVLLNPYTPPLRVSVSDDTRYHQIGLLKAESGPNLVIPLMAKVVNRKRSMWNYYTLHDSNTMVKLPVVSKSKSCTGEYGCDELSTGETVMVEGYDVPFRVSLYDNMY